MHQRSNIQAFADSITIIVLLFCLASQGFRPNSPSHQRNVAYQPPSPQTMIENAQGWVSAGVSYNQDTDPTTFYPNAQGYRRDCSGFVSMAWELPSQPNGGYNTDGLATVTKSVSKGDLQQGDILLNRTGGGVSNNIHVVLFAGWTDANGNHVDYVSNYYDAYEDQGGYTDKNGNLKTPQSTLETRSMPYPYWSTSDGNEYDYIPRRLDPTKVGNSTPAPSSTIKPSGVWVTPIDGQVITSKLSFSAHAHPTHPSDPAIWFVKFTINVDGAWQNACVASPPTNGDLYSCDMDVSTLFGSLSSTTTNIQVSFDVYDQGGNNNLAPNGEHTINYSVLASAPTATPVQTTATPPILVPPPTPISPTSTPVPPTPTRVPPTPTFTQVPPTHTDTPRDSATFIRQSQTPLTVNPGQQIAVFFVLKNSGNTTWSGNGGYALGCVRDCFGPNLYGLAGSTVVPGQTFQFNLSLTASTTPGQYQTRWVLQHNGQSFGPNYWIDVTVASSSINVQVSANVRWVNTGITLNTGSTLAISATGSWSADPIDGLTSPDGYAQPYPDNFLNLTNLGVCGYCASTPTPHWGALIGYIGNNPPVAGSYTSTSVLPEAKKVFVVGSSFQSSTLPAGTLWLAFNDDAYSIQISDNTGQVTATITLK